MKLRIEIEKIYEKHVAKVKICCNEYHSHSALTDCLSGPEESVEICKLWEYISALENRLNHITSLASSEITR